MSHTRGEKLRAAGLALAVGLLLSGSARAVPFTNFSEAGTVVNGYQDDFNGTTLNPDWVEFDGGNNDPPLFNPNGSGVLVLSPGTGDPNKLLYTPAAAYSTTSQNVLALIRATSDSQGASADGFRAGPSAVSSSADGNGHVLHFRLPGQNGPGNHFNVLDDARAWGPNTDPGAGGPTWSVGQYKWLRVVSNGSMVQGKIWDAGGTPEPAAFDLTWSNPPAPARTGLAGLATDSLGGGGTFEVEYVLIQADGLPAVAVVPEPATAGLLGLAAIGLLSRRRRAV